MYDDTEEKIEKAIYYRAGMDAGFAIAYSLIQCASALSRLGDIIEIDLQTRSEVQAMSAPP